MEERRVALPPQQSPGTGRPWRLAVIVGVILGAALFTTFCGRYKIPTGSMEPSLLIGDQIVTYRLDRPWSGNHGGTLQRGDIIVFRSPPDPSREFVARVVGLPGDTVRLEENHVFIDGAALEEPYAVHGPAGGGSPRQPRDLPETVVPDESFFVLGDNRDHAYDSRHWGFVPRELVTGRALFVYWSYDAPPETFLSTGLDRLRRFLRLIPDLVSRTRWDRFFRDLSAR